MPIDFWPPTLPTTDICYDGAQFFELDDNDEPTHDPYAGEQFVSLD